MGSGQAEEGFWRHRAFFCGLTTQGQVHPPVSHAEIRLGAVNYEILGVAAYTVVYFQSIALLFVLI